LILHCYTAHVEVSLYYQNVVIAVSGQIVSVETLTVPIQDGVVDCDFTRWTECANADIPCAFILRVFYNREVNGRIFGSEKVHVGSLTPCVQCVPLIILY